MQPLPVHIRHLHEGGKKSIFCKSLKKLHGQALAQIREIRISGRRIWASVILKLAR